MIVDEHRDFLLKDIEARTSLKINRLEVGRIDFMRDIAYIRIFYYPNGPVSNPVESSDSQSDDWVLTEFNIIVTGCNFEWKVKIPIQKAWKA